MRVMRSGFMKRVEVVKALCQMKCGKAVGVEGIAMESFEE